jgi:hypothetical protein
MLRRQGRAIRYTEKLTVKKDLNSIEDIGKRIVMKYARRTGSIGRSTVGKGVRMTENIERHTVPKYVRGIGSIGKYIVNNVVSMTGNTICCIHEARLSMNVSLSRYGNRATGRCVRDACENNLSPVAANA